ncbi:MAG: hypothetical protein OEN23_17460 [Paracoccaceae bacterium]|nr:hypothetical protein [Paracoccaceae bacterium]
MEYPSRARLTEAAVKRFAPDGKTTQKMIADEGQPGLYLKIGLTMQTYVVQRQIKDPTKKDGRATVRRTLGTPTDLSVAEARSAARAELHKIEEEGAERARHRRDRKAITLGEAWLAYRAKLIRKSRSPGTISDYENKLTSEKGMASLLDKSLATLSEQPEIAADLHAKITARSGPYFANGCMRVFRAVYNDARKNRRLGLAPENPTDAVEWNPEKRADDSVPPAGLPDWYSEVCALDNGVRRAFHLFCLFSAMRPGALAIARWEHVDLENRVLHVPNPKGGEKRAFNLPLCRQLIGCLRLARAHGRRLHPVLAQTYVFPAESADGHISEWREKSVRAVGKELRQTWATYAARIQVNDLFMKLLMNHAIGSDVTRGYVTTDLLLPQLLEAQQSVADAIYWDLKDQEISRDLAA